MNLAHAYAPPATSIESPPVEPRQFSVSGVFDDAKETLRRRPAALIGLINLGIALTFGLDFLIGLLFGSSLPTMVLGVCAQFILNTWLSIGVMRIALAAARREDFSVRTLFSGGDMLVPTIVSSLLVGLVVLLATIALIIPGVVASVIFTFSTYLVIDRRADALDSLSLSARLSRGQRFRLWMLGIASGFVIVAGVLCLGIGVLVALPLVQLMSAHAYVTVFGE
jgi:uncharacterized membrane protein